jgi:hypothetical protein
MDHGNYYSKRTAALMAEGFALGAVMANTSIDHDIRDWYQDDVRTDDGDEFAKAAKQLGEGIYVLPALAGGLLIGELLDDSPPASVLGDWSDRSLRAALVGAPPMLFMQLATGASRPTETDHNSAWRPFEDSNGVSGHSFVGAFPLITAAKMTDDPIAKTAFYGASTLAAWSRVNDDAHYTSQAILGWWMAYLACSAVDQTECQLRDVHFMPVPVGDGVGMGIIWQR